jgi:hypothetical protein
MQQRIHRSWSDFISVVAQLLDHPVSIEWFFAGMVQHMQAKPAIQITVVSSEFQRPRQTSIQGRPTNHRSSARLPRANSAMAAPGAGTLASEGRRSRSEPKGSDTVARHQVNVRVINVNKGCQAHFSSVIHPAPLDEWFFQTAQGER